MLISNAVNTVDVFVMKTILQMDYLTQVKIVSLANKESSNFANYFQLCRISCISFILCDNFSNTIQYLLSLKRNLISICKTIFCGFRFTFIFTKISNGNKRIYHKKAKRHSSSVFPTFLTRIGSVFLSLNMLENLSKIHNILVNIWSFLTRERQFSNKP